MNFYELDHQDRRNQADEHRSRIPHKYPGRRDIVSKEGNGCSRQRKGNNCEINTINEEKPGAEGNGNQSSQTTCQSVDTIDEVEGIDDHQDRKHRQQDGSNLRHLINAEDAIQAGQPHLRFEDQDETGKNLPHHFPVWRHGKDIILGPDQKDDDKRTKDILKIPEDLKRGPEYNTKDDACKYRNTT